MCRQLIQVMLYNFRQWKKSPRVFLTFALCLTFCFLLADKMLRLAAAFEKTMQVAEPYICVFGDASSIAIISVLLILLFADVPMLDGGVPFYLMRISRKRWIGGQILYILATTVLFQGAIFLSTVVICAKNSFLGNMWSATGAILGYSGIGSQQFLPLSVKTMESITPYECMGEMMLLMFAYSLTLVLLMLVLDLKWGKKAGIIGGVLYSLYGLLLKPDFIGAVFQIPRMEMYRARLILGWISPLNHATYSMHNLGYDKLPSIGQSLFLLLCLSAVLSVLCVRLMKHYNFVFSGK